MKNKESPWQIGTNRANCLLQKPIFQLRCSPSLHFLGTLPMKAQYHSPRSRGHYFGRVGCRIHLNDTAPYSADKVLPHSEILSLSRDSYPWKARSNCRRVLVVMYKDT